MVFSQELKKITEKIKNKSSVKKIILFGSYATGNQQENSDFDLCIITDFKDKKINIIREIRELIAPIVNHPLDILVYTEEEFNIRAEHKSTMEYTIKRDGISLYDAHKS